VRFKEHQFLKKGDTLVTIDDREYKIALEQAEAAYHSALATKIVTSSTKNTTESNLSISDANIQASQARLWNARQNKDRYENLFKDGAATQQQYDQVKTEYDALFAQTNALKKQRNTTTLSTDEVSKRIAVNNAEIERAKAAVDLAKLNLSYTVILAPYDGVTGRRNIQEGQLVQAGQNLLTFVRNDYKWVVANYRETQLEKLKIGQVMKLKIDGIPDKSILGKVVSISEATGSRYSAIPVDNSTGNFVKVQQRVPVIIDFVKSEGTDSLMKQLRAGMNAEVSKN
jgi:membrane fusion protein (multidrug efflux system)